MSNTKKIALMSTLVLLLAVTAIFNFVLAGTQGSAVGGGASVQVNYFTSFRAERESKRSEELIQLDSIISAYATDSAEYAEAVAQKQEIVEIMEDELVLESIIKALGFSDAGVVIGERGNINVFINSSELTTETVTKVFYAIETEYNIRNGNIIIMPVYAES
ncbi:MAG: SpoIIIAH-like family protein [Clostridia bacterium]|nr:SpoIIIAH-like family protein [Clostridia bacterium]